MASCQLNTFLANNILKCPPTFEFILSPPKCTPILANDHVFKPRYTVSHNQFWEVQHPSLESVHWDSLLSLVLPSNLLPVDSETLRLSSWSVSENWSSSRHLFPHPFCCCYYFYRTRSLVRGWLCYSRILSTAFLELLKIKNVAKYKYLKPPGAGICTIFKQTFLIWCLFSLEQQHVSNKICF